MQSTVRGDTPKRAHSESNASQVSGSSQSQHILHLPRNPPYAETEPPSRVEPSPFESSLALGPPQRRRVNPESLAARLGPELVAELEKHILPGNIEMPPFSVRRDIQVKFGIDRRHIYDFFHSRGLRCLKDEKPVRKEIFFQEARPRPTRTALPPPSPKLPPAKRRRIAGPSATALPAKPPRVPRKYNKTQRKPSAALPPHEEAPIIYYEHSFLPPDFSEFISENPTSDFIPPTNTLDEDFSLERAIGDVSYAYRLRPMYERMAELQAIHCSLGPSPSIDSSVSCSSPVSSFVSSPALTVSSSFTSVYSCESETAAVKLDAPFLSRSERELHYDWLSERVGPAAGIQENVGTYKSYMNQQRDLYFDRLLHGESKRDTAADHPQPVTTDFQGWMADGKSTIAKVSDAKTFSPSNSLLPVLYLENLSTDVLDDALDSMFPYMELQYPEDDGEAHLPVSPVLRTISSPAALEDVNLTAGVIPTAVNTCIAQSHGLSSYELPAQQAHPTPDVSVLLHDKENSPYSELERVRRVRRRTFSATGDF